MMRRGYNNGGLLWVSRCSVFVMNSLILLEYTDCFLWYLVFVSNIGMCYICTASYRIILRAYHDTYRSLCIGDIPVCRCIVSALMLTTSHDATTYGVVRKNMLSQDHLSYHYISLTHWGRDKMAANLQTTLSKAFSWMKVFEFRLKFHWGLFLRVQLSIFQLWFRQWLGADQAPPEPMVVSVLTHICVTRPQWVKGLANLAFTNFSSKTPLLKLKIIAAGHTQLPFEMFTQQTKISAK